MTFGSNVITSTSLHILNRAYQRILTEIPIELKRLSRCVGFPLHSSRIPSRLCQSFSHTKTSNQATSGELQQLFNISLWNQLFCEINVPVNFEFCKGKNTLRKYWPTLLTAPFSCFMRTIKNADWKYPVLHGLASNSDQTVSWPRLSSSPE